MYARTALIILTTKGDQHVCTFPVNNPATSSFQLVQEKARYWCQVGNEARVQSMSRLEDAAKQLVGLTPTLQGLSLALFALSDLRKQLAALATSLPGAWFLLVFFLPISLWLLGLYSACTKRCASSLEKDLFHAPFAIAIRSANIPWPA